MACSGDRIQIIQSYVVLVVTADATPELKLKK